jgi:hypothetical protein
MAQTQTADAVRKSDGEEQQRADDLRAAKDLAVQKAEDAEGSATSAQASERDAEDAASGAQQAARRTEGAVAEAQGYADTTKTHRDETVAASGLDGILATEADLSGKAAGTYRVTSYSGTVDSVTYEKEDVLLDWDGSAVASVWYRAASEEDLPNDVPARSLVMEKAIYDVQQGSRSGFRVMAIGDSWAVGTGGTPHNHVAEHLAPYLSETPVYGRHLDGVEKQYIASQAAFAAAQTGGSATRTAKDDYTIQTTGSYLTFASGQEALFSKAQNNARGDRILIFLVQEPGAGSVEVLIDPGTKSKQDPGASSWRAPTSSEIAQGPALTNGSLIVDADAPAKGPRVIELVFDEVDRVGVQIRHNSGAEVRANPRVMFEVTSKPAVNIFQIAAGSNPFSAYDAAADDFLAAKIQSYKPDLVLVESADGKDDYVHFLPALKRVYGKTALGYEPYTMIPAVPSHKFSKQDVYARNDWVARYCRKVGWDQMDTEEFVGGEEGLTEVGWKGDNIHFTPRMWRNATRQWFEKRNLAQRETRTPGGNTASNEGIIQSTGDRGVAARHTLLQQASPGVKETGWMPWKFAVSGGGSGVKSGATLDLRSGDSGAGDVAAVPDTDELPIRQETRSRISLQLSLSWGTTVAMRSISANSAVYITTRAADISQGYVGALAEEGVGFRITPDGNGNAVVEGVTYHDGAMVVTPEAAPLGAYTYADFIDLQVVARASAADQVTGIADFYVSGALIGQLNYEQTFARTPIGIGLANGGDSAEARLLAMPPRLVVGY